MPIQLIFNSENKWFISTVGTGIYSSLNTSELSKEGLTEVNLKQYYISAYALLLKINNKGQVHWLVIARNSVANEVFHRLLVRLRFLPKN